jgi:hypothetical protein
MMRGRKPLLAALALVALGVAAFAATTGLPLRATEPAAAACSSCDARHQRLATIRASETAP